MADLSGKTCVIIGGSGLLGEAFSRACVAAGATVVIADIDDEKGRGLAKEIDATFEKADVADPPSIEELANKVKRVDCVVNAAYPKTKNFGKSFENAKVEDMLADLALQVGGCLSVAKAFGPLLNKNGSMVFLGSIYGVAAPRFGIYEGTKMTMPAEYAAIKGGVISLTRYFAALFGPRGIRVNAISPGGVADGQPESFVRAYSKHLKLGDELLAPEDVAGALVFLFSDASRQMTGQNLIIDGGWTL